MIWVPQPFRTVYTHTGHINIYNTHTHAVRCASQQISLGHISRAVKCLSGNSSPAQTGILHDDPVVAQRACVRACVCVCIGFDVVGWRVVNGKNTSSTTTTTSAAVRRRLIQVKQTINHPWRAQAGASNYFRQHAACVCVRAYVCVMTLCTRVKKPRHLTSIHAHTHTDIDKKQAPVRTQVVVVVVVYASECLRTHTYDTTPDTISVAGQHDIHGMLCCARCSVYVFACVLHSSNEVIIVRRVRSSRSSNLRNVSLTTTNILQYDTIYNTIQFTE